MSDRSDNLMTTARKGQRGSVSIREKQRAKLRKRPIVWLKIGDLLTSIGSVIHESKNAT